MANTHGARPLEGIRVLDFTRVLSGPHCTRMLSDLGAEVIKVEPPEGDLTRFAFPRVGSMSTYFAQQNIGKKNISMDLKAPEAVELVKALIRECDVVVENYRGGVMDKLGLGWSVVSQINPRLIYAAISGYGNSGPWSHRRAYATVVNAETGMTGLQARARGGDASNDPHSHADVYTGMECAAAVLAALFQRERTGEGQYIDVSMAQTMLYVNEHVQNELFEREVPADQIRSFQPGDYPILQTGDGTYVVVSGHPAERGTFDLFVSAMNRPELLEADHSKLDGKSLLPYMQGKNNSSAYAKSLVFHYDPKTKSDVMGQTLIHKDWRYTDWGKGEKGSELYIRKNDPFEFVNRIQEKPFLNLKNEAQKTIQSGPIPKPGESNRPRALLEPGMVSN